MASVRRWKLPVVLTMVFGSTMPNADAAIFGENDLPSLINEGVTQCNTTFGKETPPTGIFYKIVDGRYIPAGSGDTVLAEDVVVTAAHSFWRKGEPSGGGNDDVVFMVYYPDANGNCIRHAHAVASFVTGTRWPEEQPGLDFAVVKLEDPVTAYHPLSLPSQSVVEQVIAEGRPIVLTGFASHEATEYGRHLSLVTCRGMRPPATGHHFSKWPNGILHDCDAVMGMSGGALTYALRHRDGTIVDGIRRTYVRYFLGVQTVIVSEQEGRVFDLHTEYNGAAGLNSGMRAMIEAAAALP